MITSSTPAAGDVILDVANLQVSFDSPDGKVHAVNGVSFQLRTGEALGVVGESGSGKSVTMMSLLSLLPSPPASVDEGSAVLTDGDRSIDLLTAGGSPIRRIRGGKVGFVFQDPLSALNPTMRVGQQIAESVRKHRGVDADEAEQIAVELLAAVGIADPEAAIAASRTSSRGDAPAGDDRHRHGG
jgi:oligopeptide transport system ATP-binding protein